MPMKNCSRCGRDFDPGPRGGLVCPQCRKTPSADLTFREIQVVEKVCLAKMNKEIAFELHLSEGTIKEYINRIFHKLGLRSRMELALWWQEHKTETKRTK